MSRPSYRPVPHYRLLVTACLVLLGSFLLLRAPADSQAAAVRASALTGPWELQSPLPTRSTFDDVDMLSATIGWAVADREILHTTDGGVTWAHQTSPIADHLYSVRFLDALHGWIGTNNAVLYTSDGGQTWQAGSGVVGSIYFVEFANLTTGFASYGGAGMYRSTDGGHSWTFRSMANPIGGVQFFDANTGVANSPAGVYHTSDAGATWQLTAGPHGGTWFVTPSLGWYVSQDQAARTTDGGATWQPQTLPAGSWVYDSMFVDANNGWAVGNTLVRTTNGGTTWTTTPINETNLPPFWAVDFTSPADGVVVGNAGQVYTSATGGATWVRRSRGLGAEVLDIAARDADHAWASQTFGRVMYTTNGGTDWQPSLTGDTAATLHGISMADLQTGWTVGESGTGGTTFKTTDGGATWQHQVATSQRLFSVAALSPQTVIVVGGGTQFTVARRSTDGGANWQTLPVPLGDAIFMDVFFVNATTGWIVGNNGGIARTDDGGDTWVQQPAPTSYGLVDVSFSDPNNGWAGGYFQILFHTTDGGATWLPQNPGIPDRTHVLAVSAISASDAWIAGYGSGPASIPYVKYTTNGGATWVDHTPAVGPYDSFSALKFLGANYGWAGGAAGVFKHGSGTPVATPTVPSGATATLTRVPSSATATATGAPPTGTPPGPPASPTRTATVLVSVTSVPLSATPTASPVGPGSSPTRTATVLSTTTAVPGVSPTPTVCLVQFTDVPPGSTFYDTIRCLACRGIVGGYPCGGPGEPCPGTYFRPNNNVTRGQVSKIVAEAAGLADVIPSTQQTFQDVASGSTFGLWIERLTNRGIIGGYPCGGPGEPCQPPANRPYFRPGNAVTRGQLAKIVAGAALWTETPAAQTFEDVPPGSTFYVVIGQVASRGIVGGYACGGPGEPCVSPGNRPYFRPNNPATRGQMSKIAAQAFFPNCQTPAGR